MMRFPVFDNRARAKPAFRANGSGLYTESEAVDIWLNIQAGNRPMNIDVKQGGFTTYPLEYVALGLLMSEPKHGYALY